MKAKVIVSNLFVDGVKYTRGQIVEVDDVNKFGTKLEMVTEPEPKPVKKVAKKRSKKVAKKVENGED